MDVRMRTDCSVWCWSFPDVPLTPGVLIAEMMLEAASRGSGGMGCAASPTLFSNLRFSGRQAALSSGRLLRIAIPLRSCGAGNVCARNWNSTGSLPLHPRLLDLISFRKFPHERLYF